MIDLFRKTASTVLAERDRPGPQPHPDDFQPLEWARTDLESITNAVRDKALEQLTETVSLIVLYRSDGAELMRHEFPPRTLKPGDTITFTLTETDR